MPSTRPRGSGRALALLASLSLTLSACAAGGDTAPSRASPRSSPTFPTATVLISTGHGTVLVHAQVADTPERRQQGLSGRSHLPRDAGMVFLFFRDSTASFYMRDTVVPLSIAFFDVHGKILDIEDMDPCRREHCKLFSPGVPYRGALEVNQGAFSDWGVEVGDVVHVAP